MNNKPDNLTLIRELLITQMNHWMLFPIYVLIVVICDNITGNNNASLSLLTRWLIFGCIPFLLYLGRVLFKKVWILLFLSGVTLFLMYILPTSHVGIQILHVGIGLAYVINSIHIRIQSPHMNNAKIPPVAGVAISTVCLFALTFRGRSDWTTAFATILIAILGLFFIAYYVEQYQNFISADASSAGYIAQKEFFRSGFGLVMGYTGVSLVILSLVSNTTWLKVILQVVKNIFVFFLRLLFSLLPQGTQTEESTPSPVTMDMTAYLEPTAGQKTFPFWLFLEKVALLVTICGAIFLTIKIVSFLVHFIQRLLQNYDGDTAQNAPEEDVFDVREKCDIEKESPRQAALSLFIKNPDKRIRQMYKKRLLSSRTIFAAKEDTHALEKYTARESGKLLQRDSFAQIYEKARYSNQNCNEEDVRQMKNACK